MGEQAAFALPWGHGDDVTLTGFTVPAMVAPVIERVCIGQQKSYWTFACTYIVFCRGKQSGPAWKRNNSHRRLQRVSARHTQRGSKRSHDSANSELSYRYQNKSDCFPRSAGGECHCQCLERQRAGAGGRRFVGSPSWGTGAWFPFQVSGPATPRYFR